MTTVNRAGWDDRHPTKQRPIYVRFDPSKGVRRTRKNDGLTLNGVTAGFTKADTLEVEEGRLTLYDNYFGPENNRIGLTNPLALYKNDRGYWQVGALGGDDDVVLDNIQNAEAAKEHNGNGQEYGGGKSMKMTREELIAAIAWSALRAKELGAFNISPGEAFAKILGCAMFIDWPQGEESETKPAPAMEPPPVTDNDIPF